MKVLLVDDHAVVRRGLRNLFADEIAGAECHEAATGEEAVAIVEKQAFDVVVLDISMPRRGGLDALKDLQARQPKLPVIVLSQHAEEQYAVRALRAGARAYLSKNGAPEELVRAVQKVLSGGRYVTESLADRLAGALDLGHEGALHDSLSDRELQVLRMLASGKSTKEIAIELSLSEKTVSTYRSRLLEKLNLTGNAELMRYALREGLVD